MRPQHQPAGDPALAELMQLAQLQNMLSGPQIEHERMATSERSQRLQAALAALGLQQQADEGAATRALREHAMTQEGEQFGQELGFKERGLAQAHDLATADQAFRGDELDFRRNATADQVAEGATNRASAEHIAQGNQDVAMKQLYSQIYQHALTIPGFSPQLLEHIAGHIDPQFGQDYAEPRVAGKAHKAARLSAMGIGPDGMPIQPPVAAPAPAESVMQPFEQPMARVPRALANTGIAAARGVTDLRNIFPWLANKVSSGLTGSEPFGYAPKPSYVK